MALPHDSGGFLTGERLVSGMDAVKSDTDAILALLRAGMNRSGEDAEATRRAQEEIARNTRQTRDVGQREEAGGESDRTITRRAQEGGSRRRAPAPSPGAGPDASPEQARNERGQYTGDGDGESDAKKQGWMSRMVDAVKGRFGVGTPDADNVDPAVTAMQEAAQLMAPIAKVGGMLFGAGRWLLGRKKDDVPKEQRRHNKLIEKLLKKIANLRGDGGLGGPVLGGFIGGLVERFGPMLAAAVPMLGGLLFKGLGLALAWKGGYAIGTWIYKTFQPQIDAVADAIGGAVKSAIDAYDSAVARVTSWIESVVNAYDTAVQTASRGIEWIADKLDWIPGMPKKEKATRDSYASIQEREYLAAGFSAEEVAKLKGQALAENEGQNPLAKSTTGAFGLTQFMPATAKQYGVIPGESTEAIASQYRGQARYMAVLKKKYGGDWDKMYAAYNAGPGNVDQAIEKAEVFGGKWQSNLPKVMETLPYIQRAKTFSSKFGTATSAFIPSDVFGSATRTVTMSLPTPRIPASTAGIGVLKIPPAPKIQQQVGGKDAAIPVVIQGSVSDISQNVSDRNLAHLITGGLGMDYRGQ